MTTTVALTVGTLGWNISSGIRALILVVLVLMVVLNKRRLDWVGVLAIMAVLIIRLTTQLTR